MAVNRLTAFTRASSSAASGEDKKPSDAPDATPPSTEDSNPALLPTNDVTTEPEATSTGEDNAGKT